MLNRIFNWLKLSKPSRMNLRGQYYAKRDYEQTTNYAKANISVSGVKELSEQLENGYKNYLQEMESIVNNEATTEDEKYTRWTKISNIKNICKYSAIALLLLTIICMRFESNFSDITCILLVLAILVGCVVKIIDMIYKKKYRSYDRSISDKFSSINSKYARIFSRIYQDIDNLYLNSLDPAHREMVLMRREQNRHNQEVMRANAQLAEEQRRARIAQEELLQIEKERERRYNRY